MSIKEIALTGDRPTGKLHLGHLVGSLENRLKFQETYQQFIMIADAQALTDNFDNPEKVRNSILEVASDYMAVGIDPAKSTIFIQSMIPELTELTFYYLNLVTIARLERNPTIKEELKLRGFERDIPAGFLCYPVSQAADISAFRAKVVPVGEDQIPMIEQTNEIVRKFNRLFPGQVLVEAEAIVPKTGRLPGVDGKQKMSKSLGNALNIRSTPDEISTMVNKMYTDANHLRVADPGQIEGNVVFTYLDLFHPDKQLIEELKAHYQRGGLADNIVKKHLEACLVDKLGIYMQRASQYSHDDLVEILKAGTAKAREVAAKTLSDVKKAMGIQYF
jgi:tryptophanyl-tRNA synthetase